MSYLELKPLWAVAFLSVLGTTSWAAAPKHATKAHPSYAQARAEIVGADANKNNVRDDVDAGIGQMFGVPGSPGYDAGLNFAATVGDVVAYGNSIGRYDEAEFRRLTEAMMCLMAVVGEEPRSKADEVLGRIFDTSKRKQMMQVYFERVPSSAKKTLVYDKGERACKFSNQVHHSAVSPVAPGSTATKQSDKAVQGK